MLYDVGLTITYEYAVPADAGRHLVRLMPADLPGEQRAIAGTLTVAPLALWNTTASTSTSNCVSSSVALSVSASVTVPAPCAAPRSRPTTTIAWPCPSPSPACACPTS